MSFRTGFYAGLLLAVVLGLYLFRLWQPQRQVELHSTHLLRSLEQKDWARLSASVDEGYADRWGHDRALLLARLREVLRYARNLRIESQVEAVRAEPGEGTWSARITVDAEPNELTAFIKERVNALDAPFELHWRRNSGKPWDWKLTRVSHAALELPQGGY